MVYYLHRLQQNTLIVLYQQPLNLNSTEQLLKKSYFQLTVCVCVSYGGDRVVARERERKRKMHDLENGIININAISLLINITLNQEIYKKFI